MIKRRFYRHEHGDGDNVSDSSSSSSDSELEADATEQTEAEDVDDVSKIIGKSYSSSSGYESKDSSANGFDADSPGLLTNDDNTGTANDGDLTVKSLSSRKTDAEIVDKLYKSLATKDSVSSDAAYILKCKSVFKCRLCPRVVCLTEDTLKAHLKSKRHARSEKLLSEGRLKLMLNSDGEIEGEEEEEEEGETHAERHARTIAAVQSSSNSNSKKNNKGRQRQRRRLKKRKEKDSNLDKASQSTKQRAKKRQKSET
ncbi:hypothetical protein NMG60_11028623 [Bertholletia excelsa]